MYRKIDHERTPLSVAGAKSRQPLRLASFSPGEQPGVERPKGRHNEANTLISIVLPAKNEAAALRALLPRLRVAQPEAEIIVVDDGSSDATPRVCAEAGIRFVTQPYSMGNGAAIKRGAREASGDVIVFMDGDGQHDPADIARLVAKLDGGYDMVVGARDWSGQAGVGRGVANAIYNWLASWITGFAVLDLTSGFRAVRANKFREFLHLLPNGFSYPTTITMAFFRSAYAVTYERLAVHPRVGKSHIKPIRDGLRFLLIIFKIATLYSPLKLFVPASALFFLFGAGNYVYTFSSMHRLTNMSVLLFSAAVIVFLIGLISEQITALTYRPIQDRT
jgi:glycosyltransferase involved in cell wall biosynthesis